MSVEKIYNFETKEGVIKWLKDDFIIAYSITDDKKITDVMNLLWKKDYDELYRLANAVQRFGWELIFELV